MRAKRVWRRAKRVWRRAKRVCSPDGQRYDRNVTGNVMNRPLRSDDGSLVTTEPVDRQVVDRDAVDAAGPGFATDRHPVTDI